MYFDCFIGPPALTPPVKEDRVTNIYIVIPMSQALFLGLYVD